jgi:uncharacterized protein (TIGR02266 family)
MPNERRAHPRFPLILAVQYLGAEDVLDYTENLSAGGLFIRTEREFEPGERVTLVVSFPQLLEPMELQVEVLRRREGRDGTEAGVAVRVPDDRREDREKLAEVARRLAGSRGPSPSFRVLLVEDNALVASMYGAALRRLSETDDLTGLEIEVASDGAAAWDRLLRGPAIDAVVTDLFMPNLSGIHLVERIRAEPALAPMPIVVITSAGEPERERLAALGVSLFLRKPVSYQHLAGTVRSLLASRLLRTASAPAQVPPREAALPEDLPGDEGVHNKWPDAKPASRR